MLLASSTRAACASAWLARSWPMADASAARWRPKRSSSQLALIVALLFQRMVPASGGGTAPFFVKRWSLMSSEPLTCGARAAPAASTAACACTRRACTVCMLGALARALSIRPLSWVSPHALHQSACGQGVSAAAAPACAGCISACDAGATPAVLAQPATSAAVASTAPSMVAAVSRLAGNVRSLRGVRCCCCVFCGKTGSTSIRRPCIRGHRLLLFILAPRVRPAAPGR